MKNAPYLVATVSGIHAGLAHAFEHEGITGDNGKQGQEVDCEEAVDDEDSLEVGRGEDFGAVCLWANPVSCLQTLIHSYGDGHEQGAWRGQRTQETNSIMSITGSFLSHTSTIQVNA